MLAGIGNINYDNGSHGTYNVDWPDGIKPLGGASLCAAFTGTDYDAVGGMGIEYEGTFGLSNQTGGIVYLSVGFEAIYPETIRNDLMLRIINKYESQLNVVDELNIYPSELKINNVYPNPSNNSITISFSVLSQKSPIEINIKNILGQHMYKTYITPISNNINWTWDGAGENGFNAPSGSYFISISQKNISQTRKITILK